MGNHKMFKEDCDWQFFFQFWLNFENLQGNSSYTDPVFWRFGATYSCLHWLSRSTVTYDIHIFRWRPRTYKMREQSHILRANFLKKDFAFEIRLTTFAFLLVGKILTSLLSLNIFIVHDAGRYFTHVNSVLPIVSWLRKWKPHRYVSQIHIFFLYCIWIG